MHFALDYSPRQEELAASVQCYSPDTPVLGEEA